MSFGSFKGKIRRILGLNNQKGSAMLFVLALALIGSIVVSSMYLTSRYTIKKSGGRRDNVDLINITEGGINDALAKLRHTDITLAEGQSLTLVSSGTLGNGSYEVRYSDYIPGTSLRLQAKGVIGQQEKMIDATVDIYCKGIGFDINDGQAVPQESFKPTITILGASVTYGAGGYNIPITVEVNIDGNSYYPFGSIDLPVDGNVNDVNNPRYYSFSSTFSSGSAVSVKVKSWVKKSSYYSGDNNTDWKLYREVNSTPDNGWVKVLRDKDSVPDLDGFAGQADVEAFIREYVNASSLTMNLGPNDAIYLVEVGSQTGLSADYQDCVILVTLDGNPNGGGGCSSWAYEISSWKER